MSTVISGSSGCDGLGYMVLTELSNDRSSGCDVNNGSDDNNGSEDNESGCAENNGCYVNSGSDENNGSDDNEAGCSVAVSTVISGSSGCDGLG